MGQSAPHSWSRNCRGPSGRVRWGDRTEGTRPDPWAVFTPTPVVSTGTALFGPNGLWSHYTIEETEAERLWTIAGRASTGTQGS